MLRFIILGFLWAACSGQQFNPSIGNKPILRIRSNDLDKPAYLPPVTTESSSEPGWVTLLRNNIKTAVKYKGFDRAKNDIKSMIDNADQQINGDRALRNKESVASLRSFTEGIYPSNNNDISRPSFKSKWEPRWEKDLKNYIKGLIGQHGKSHLDDYVRPVVSAIETSNGVMIRDIDGEVSVNWKPTQDGPSSRARYNEYQDMLAKERARAKSSK